MEHYPFMARNDGTEITFSDIKIQNNNQIITVYFERWSKERDDFDSMQINVPNGEMEKVIGYTCDEIAFYSDFADRYYPLFVKFAKQKGVGNRA